MRPQKTWREYTYIKKKKKKKNSNTGIKILYGKLSVRIRPPIQNSYPCVRALSFFPKCAYILFGFSVALSGSSTQLNYVYSLHYLGL